MCLFFLFACVCLGMRVCNKNEECDVKSGRVGMVVLEMVVRLTFFVVVSSSSRSPNPSS